MKRGDILTPRFTPYRDKTFYNVKEYNEVKGIILVTPVIKKDNIFIDTHRPKILTRPENYMVVNGKNLSKLPTG